MRFPLALTVKIARHIVKHKVKGTPKFAMVLQLEPLHTCNLTCTGCGRIREYSTSLKDMVPLEQCLAAAQDCDAPMVSICGGEPLIYPKIEELVAGLREQVWPKLGARNPVFPLVDSVHSLADAQQVHEYFDAGKHVGKIVLVP